MTDDVRIPVFDGKDYDCWKRRILMILKLKKCDVVATRAIATADDKEDWVEKDLKAINVIYSGISNDQLQFVKDKETTYDIIKKFDEMYLKESTALQICVRNKLEKLRLKDFEDSSTFFTAFEKLINELKSAGANVSEKEKLSYMIKMLPSSLSHIGDLIDVLKESDQTVEYVKSKIKMCELKEKEEGGKNSSSAFKTERKKDRTCYKCGRYGHFQAQCTSTRSNENSWKARGGAQQRGSGRQYQHHRGGMQQQGGARQQQHWQHRGGDGRGAGRGSSQHRLGGGWQQHQQGRQNEDASNFNVESEVSSDMSKSRVEVNSCVGKIEWLLDSGCSDHVVNDDKYFYECVELKEPIKVKVANGSFLNATKIGNIFHKFNVYGQSKVNHMKKI